jgi:hypothetical protein
MSLEFWLPTRPFNVIAAVNRMTAATGSIRYAQAAAGADYNGHNISLTEPNSHVSYWRAYYIWSGINYVARGTLRECLDGAKREYDRGALGASAHVKVETEEDAQTCRDAGWLPYSKEIEAAHDATWRTPLHDLVNEAIAWEKNGLFPGAVGVLVQCKTVAEYQARRDAYRDELNAYRGHSVVKALAAPAFVQKVGSSFHAGASINGANWVHSRAFATESEAVALVDRINAAARVDLKHWRKA